MSTDYEDKEREFLAYLKADTGRDLSGWMAAIEEAKLAHRNEIIDWLRQQGFIFAWASWLERIHHNGGRPIYLDEPPQSIAAPMRSPVAPRQTSPPSDSVSSPASSSTSGTRAGPRPASSAPITVPTAPPSRPVLVYSAPATVGPVNTDDIRSPAPTPARAEPQESSTLSPAAVPGRPADLSPELSSIISKAKAFAPLARLILRDLTDALPGTSLKISGNYITCNRPQTFAILVPSPKDIKLGFALASAPFERKVTAARFSHLAPAPPRSITYMAVLTDARQVDAELLDLLRSADAAING